MQAGPESQSVGGFQGFVRDHHVTYGVEQEPPAATQRTGSTFDVQLFATHGEDRLEAPTCPRCVELTQELYSFAVHVLASAGAQQGAEILEPSPVLYASTDPRGPDEVSLVLRVVEERPEERAASGATLRRIEDRLKALGVSRR